MQPRQMIVALGVLLNEKGELFLIKRNNPSVDYHESLALPGGKMDFGEDPREAVKREMLEETGFEVEVLDLLPEIWSNMLASAGSSTPDIQAILFAYKCKLVSGEFKPNGREVLEGGFFSKDILQTAKCMKPVKEVFELISN